MTEPVVILFARAPRLGCVKRRLAAGIGDVPALRFHRNQLGRLTCVLKTLRGYRVRLAITPDRARFPRRLPAIGQGRGDLGVRMQRAFRKFPGRRVILIGADIPGLNAATLRAAARALKHHHAVFGPAADGGYYLVGMAARRPAHPFAGVAWSSPTALADTLKNFRDMKIALLPTLPDVDTAADLQLAHCGAPANPVRLGIGTA